MSLSLYVAICCELLLCESVTVYVYSDSALLNGLCCVSLCSLFLCVCGCLVCVSLCNDGICR